MNRKFKIGQLVRLDPEKCINKELYERNKDFVGRVIGYGSFKNDTRLDVVRIIWPVGCYLSLHWDSEVLKLKD